VPIYEVSHHSRQRYLETVVRSRNEVRLHPIESATQHSLWFQLDVSPMAELASQVDYYGNQVWFVSVETPHRELVLVTRAEVEVVERPFGYTLGRPWDETHLAFNPAAEFTFASPRVPRLKAIEALSEELGVKPGDGESLLAANAGLRQRFAYVPGATAVDTALEEVLERRMGVCQDFAHVMLAVARNAGWPARYVSGYMLPESEDAVIGESHAWVEVSNNNGYWVGLDPTHGIEARGRHLSVAVGRDYDDVTPVRGAFLGQFRGEPPEVTVTIRLKPADPERELALHLVDQ
jgi:transglutaminase-like putative cysteine protease